MEKNIQPSNLPNNPVNKPVDKPIEPQRKSGRVKMLLILAVCLTPVLASYFTYYVIKPTARTNYGELLDAAKYPMPKLGAIDSEGKAVELTDHKGKWLLIQVDSGDCNQVCRVKVLDMRQVHATLGKERDRFERVWLVTDDRPLNAATARIAEGMLIMRVKPDVVNAWLPVDGGRVSDYLYVVDPLGNLILRYPKALNLYKLKADLTKLLTASSIG